MVTAMAMITTNTVSTDRLVSTKKATAELFGSSNDRRYGAGFLLSGFLLPSRTREEPKWLLIHDSDGSGLWK